MGPTSVYSYQALAPHYPNKHMDPYVLKDPPNRKGKAVFQHEGEEMLYVLEGKTKFFYGDKEFILEEGDCLYFDASVPHYGVALDDKEFKCLLVLYTPELMEHRLSVGGDRQPEVQVTLSSIFRGGVP